MMNNNVSNSLPAPSMHERKTSGNADYIPIKLYSKFITGYRNKVPSFGFNGLGELVYRRTYSRVKDNKDNEEWYETIERVVNGTYNMMKKWIEEHDLGWQDSKGQTSMQEMYDRIYDMKFLPPGRGLWAMGSPITEQRNLNSALNNCAFVSTSNLATDKHRPFTFLMDASMLGVGVGFDLKGADSKLGNPLLIKGVDHGLPVQIFVIPDSREGWVEAMKKTIMSHVDHLAEVAFDYSLIRPYGVPIKGFGGKASGPEPLRVLLNDVNEILARRTGTYLIEVDIADIMNKIGVCVVAGNVR